MDVLAPRTWKAKQSRWVVHLPKGDDSWCSMISTGGIKRRNYRLLDYDDLPAPAVCDMCSRNFEKAGKVDKLRQMIGTLWQR